MVKISYSRWWKTTSGATITLFNDIAMARGSSGDEEEFSNNLISDLAPLLALFGEQFTKQFMSHSLTFYDNIIFAMAPIGIITAIVGAIRTGGPAWLRSVVGRAKENDAASQVEYMSSVSHEVCEVWNGHSVVRIPGSPDIQMLIYVSDRDERKQKNKQTPRQIGETRTFGVFTLMDTLAQQHAIDLHSKEIRKSSKDSPKATLVTTEAKPNGRPPLQPNANEHNITFYWDSEEGDGDPEEPKKHRCFELFETYKLASNITLNLSRCNIDHLKIGAVIGVLLQTATLIASGLLVYMDTPRARWRQKKGAEDVEGYAYPLNVVGTILLAIGMFVCASVIEQSTIEYKWTHQPLDDRKKSTKNIAEGALDVLWVQRKLLINDQSFESYALVAPKPLHDIITSFPTNLFTTLEEKKATDSEGAMPRLPVNRPPHSRSKGSNEKTQRLRAIISRIFKTLGLRVRSAKNALYVASIAGTIISTAGFIIQFVGLRASHWSAAVTQLIATVIMIGIRVWVRRTLIEEPLTHELKKDHELDWLALALHADFQNLRQRSNITEKKLNPKVARWYVATGTSFTHCKSTFVRLSSATGQDPPTRNLSSSDDTNDAPSSKGKDVQVTPAIEFDAVALGGTTQSEGSTSVALAQSPSQEATDNAGDKLPPLPFDRYESFNPQDTLEMRLRLGSLTKWTSSMTQRAVKLASCIEEVLNMKNLIDIPETENFLEWSIPAKIFFPDEGTLDVGCLEKGQIRFSAKRVDKDSLWEANQAELDAALSLWVYYGKEIEKTPEATQSSDWIRKEKTTHSETRALRLLGPLTESVRRDLNWWIGGDALGDVCELEISKPACESKDAGSDGGSKNRAADGSLKEVRLGQSGKQSVNSRAEADPIDAQHIERPDDKGIDGAPPPWKIAYATQEVEETSVIEIKRHKVIGFVGDGHFDRVPFENLLDSWSKNAKPLSFDLEAAIPPPKDLKCLAMFSHLPVEELFTTHLFTAFIWAIAKRAKNITGKMHPSHKFEPSSARKHWNGLRLADPNLTNLASSISALGMTRNIEEALLLFVPAFSAHEKLFVTDSIVPSVHGAAMECISSDNWQEARTLYDRLLDICQNLPKRADSSVPHQSDSTVVQGNLLAKAVALGLFFEDALASKLELESSREFPDKDAVVKLEEVARTSFTGFHSARKEGLPMVAQVDVAGGSQGVPYYMTRLRQVIGRYSFPGLAEPSKALVSTKQKAWLTFDPGSSDNTDEDFHFMGWQNCHKSAIWPNSPSVDPGIEGTRTPVPESAQVRENSDTSRKRTSNGEGTDVLDANAVDVLGRTPFHYLAMRRDQNALQVFLNSIPSNIEHATKKHDLFGWAPIHYFVWMTPTALEADSSQEKNMAILYDYFLNQKSPAFALKDPFHKTPLLLACLAGNIHIVRALLDRGADPNSRSPSGTALHLTASSRDRKYSAEITRLLINSGANVKAVSGDDGTALHEAARRKNFEVFQVLVQHGGDSTAIDTKRRRPVQIAAYFGQIKLVQWAVTERVDAGGDPMRDELISIVLDPNSSAATTNRTSHSLILLNWYAEKFGSKRSPEGRTVLHIAAGYSTEVKGHFFAALLSKVDIFAEDNKAKTALHVAAKAGQKEVVYEIIQLFDKRIAEASSNPSEEQDDDGENAASGGVGSKEASIRLSYFQKRDLKGKTALHLAALKGHEMIAKRLLEAAPPAYAESSQKGSITGQQSTEIGTVNLNTTTVPPESASAMDRAGGSSMIDEERTTWAKKLLSVEDSMRRTALFDAVLGGNLEIIRLFIAMGAEIEAVDTNGRTVLHLSCSSANTGIEVLLLLLNNGSSEGTVVNDQEGQKPLHLASANGNLQLVEVLCQHMLQTGHGPGTIGSTNAAGRSPFYIAASKGFIPIAEKLWTYEDGNQQRLNAWLRFALAARDVSAIGSLLTLGADPKTTTEDEFSGLPLHCAVNVNSLTLLDILVKSTKSNSDEESVLDINGTDGLQRTAFYIAVEKDRRVAAVRLLENERTDLNIADAQGTTPLMAAIIRNGGDEDAAMWFLLRFAYMRSIAFDAQDSKGNTALHYAAFHGMSESVSWLLYYSHRKVQTVAARALDGNTPLHVALKKRHYGIARQLISNYFVPMTSSEIMAVNADGLTALDIALRQQTEYSDDAATEDAGTRTTEERFILDCFLENQKLAPLALDPDEAGVLKVDTIEKDTGRTKLHIAIRNGYSAGLITALLDWKPDLTIVDKDEKTALHAAIEVQNPEIVDKLLAHYRTLPTDTAIEAGGNPLRLALHQRTASEDGDKESGDTPLRLALRRCCVEGSTSASARIVSSLLAEHTAGDEAVKDSLLAVDVSCMPLSFWKDLIQKGADLSKRDLRGDNILLQLLRMDHADIEASRPPKDSDEDLDKKVEVVLDFWTPVVSKPSVGSLEGPGASLDGSGGSRDGSGGSLEGPGGSQLELNDPNDSGETLVYLCVRKGLVKQVKRLLGFGAKITEEHVPFYRYYGKYVSVRRRSILVVGLTNGGAEMLRCLLDAFSKTDHNVLSKMLDYIDPDAHVGPLHRAAQNGDLEACRMLLERGATVDLRDETRFKSTALHWACKGKHLRLVKMLVEKGAEVDAKNERGETPFLVASSQGETDIMTFLKSKGAAMDITDKQGEMALHKACRSGRQGAVELLLKQYGDVQLTAFFRGEATATTPLHCAVRNGHLDVVKMLVSRGADPNVQELEEGCTSLHLAIQYGWLELVKYLLDPTDIVGAIHPDLMFQMQLGYSRRANAIALSISTNQLDILKALLASGKAVEAIVGDGLLHKASPFQMCFAQYKPADGSAGSMDFFASLLSKLDRETYMDLLSIENPEHATLHHFAAFRGILPALTHLDSHSHLKTQLFNRYYGSPVQIASACDHDKSILEILSSSDDYYFRDEHGWTAVEYQRWHRTDKRGKRNSLRKTANVKLEPPSRWSPHHKHSAMEFQDPDNGLIISLTLRTESAGWQTRTETRIDFHRSCMADHPIPYNMEDFYFEVTIVNLPAISDRKPVVAIGLTNCISPTNCLPGWWNQSIGYHSDDGNVFLGNLDQLTTGSNAMRRVCAVTDVMGCGRHNEQFYFTKNGQLIFICEGLGRELPRRGRYFPMIGFLGGSGDHFLVRTKFKDTPEDPFRFNYSKEGAFVTDGPKWKTSSTTESSGSSMFELQDFFNDLKDDNPSVSAPEDDTSQSVTEGGNQSGSAPNASAPSASAPDGGDQIGSASVDDNQSGSGPEDDSQSVVGAPIHQ